MERRCSCLHALFFPARVAASLLAFLPGEALGQSGSLLTGGVLTGTVTDASTRAPIPNVVVTATSPALQGEQVVLTDDTGTYRVPQLPSGTYALRFEREDYKPLTREGIEVPVGYTLRFNPQLIPEVAGAAAITVVGQTPLVNVGSTEQGWVVERAFISTIPLNAPLSIGGASRSFENVALAVPGVRPDRYGVGINGATSPENSYVIDGLSTRNAILGVRGSLLSVEFVESVAVQTGGYLPEYGRTTGGIIAANTRSGGDEFHGSIWGTWTPGSLAGTPHPVQAADSVLSFRSTLLNIVDFGVSLGGYLVKDRLWFFVGVQPEATQYRIYRDLRPYGLDAQGKGRYEDPIYTDSRLATERQLQYFTKLTYLVNDDHRLSLTITGTPSRSGSATAYSLDYLTPGQAGEVGSASAFLHPAFDGSVDVVGKLSSSFSDKRVLLDLLVGWHEEDHNFGTADGSKLGSTDPAAVINQPRVNWAPRSLTEFETLPPSVVANCLSDGNDGRTRCSTRYFTGGPGVVANDRTDTFQGRAVATFLAQALGHHVVKLGFDGEVSTEDYSAGYSGGALLREARVGGPIQARFVFGYMPGPDELVDLPMTSYNTKTVIVGGFVQDSWSILDRVTLNIGVRYEAQTIYGPGNQVGLSFPSEWSPRAGLIWDFTQQGRSKVYASYARYYENIPLFVAGVLGKSGLIARGNYPSGTGDCNPKSSMTASCRSTVTPGTFVPPNPSWQVVAPDQADPVDPQIAPPSVDEWVAGFQYELLPNTRFSLGYTHRNVVRWVEDIGRDGTDLFIGNPGYGAGAIVPPAQRVYDSFVVALDKVYADLWLAQVSYTYQKLTGNFDGLSRGETGQLFPNLNSDFDVQRLTQNGHGPLSGDITHTVKAYLGKDFVVAPWFSVTAGFAYVGSSGPPISWLGMSSIYGAKEVHIFPRGSGGRLAWQHTIDVNGALNFRLAGTTVLTLSVNVFNLFNFQQVTEVDQNYNSAEGVAPVPGGNPATDKGKIVHDYTGKPLAADAINSRFLQPAAYQPIRQVRFQARLSF